MKHINKILVGSDFLYSRNESKTYGEKGFNELMKFQIKEATNIDIEYFTIDRQRFFDLSGINFTKDTFNSPYVLSDISEESIAYLKSQLPSNVIFLGSGLSAQTQELLDKIGVTFINYWNHPIHYLDEFFFAWNTNDSKIHAKMLEFKVDERLFKLYANYFTLKLMWHMSDDNNPLNENSVLFIGQSMNDKSIELNGKFLNITDFEDQILKLKESYSTLYYAPHPKHKFNNVVKSFVEDNNDFIKVLEGCNTYELLANPRVKKVIGISSSTLYEAQQFGKDVEYLFKPFCEFKDEFDFRKYYIGIYNDNFSVKFWQQILSPVMCVTDNPDLNFINFNNKIRDLNPSSLYWGFKDLDKVQKFINETTIAIRKKEKLSFWKKIFKK